jgi:hypothetical protein
MRPSRSAPISFPADLILVLRRYWPAFVATAVLLPHALAFDFLNDDAYISFRYAKNLAEHGQLVFNLGERVEGFTNFLWTVLLAAGLKLGVAPEVSSRFLGVAFAVGTLATVVRMSLRLDGERPSPFHLIAPLGLATMGAFACWCSGGLETQLFTFLSTLAFERLLAETATGRGASSGAFFALAAMTRPEGALFFGLGGLFRLLTNLRDERRLWPRPQEGRWVGLFAILFVPYFAWRWRYYGWPFPNTFYVKSSAAGMAQTLDYGLFYVRRFAEDYGGFFLAALVLAGWPRAQEARRVALFRLGALVWAAFLAYTVKVGGDFMGLYRFILPIVPLGAVLVQEAARTLGGRLRPIVGAPVLAVVGAGIAAGFVVGSLKVTRNATTYVGAEGRIIDTPAYLKKYADERVAVGKWFGKHARPDDLMTVGGAGVIPYYSGIPAYDVFGLVDETIAHDPSMTHDSRPGHQKWGSDEYMLSRKPTLITHRYCLGAPCELEQWFRPPGFEWVRIPDIGVYYSFLKRTDRAFGPFPAR